MYPRIFDTSAAPCHPSHEAALVQRARSTPGLCENFLDTLENTGDTAEQHGPWLYCVYFWTLVALFPLWVPAYLMVAIFAPSEEDEAFL